MIRDLRRLFDLEGRVAIVTGGGSGLGQALAQGLAQFGARVSVVDIEEEAALETADGIRGQGGRAIALRCDVTDPSAVDAAVRATATELGSIAILVANAGIGDRAAAVDMTSQQWSRVIDVNLTGAWLFDQAVGRHMIERGTRGSIVNTSSVASLVGVTTGNANYAASKGGLNALTRLLAIEWATHGIRVNAIAPTHIRTPMIGRQMEADPGVGDYFLSNIPLGRLGEPEDVVGAAIYLASDASALVTGHVLVVDGGHSAR